MKEEDFQRYIINMNYIIIESIRMKNIFYILHVCCKIIFKF